MPKENDLEGVQDHGGKHGGQKGMPKPESKPPTSSEPKPGDVPDQGIVRDERDRSSRATKRALSKSAERMRCDDEFFPTSSFAASSRAARIRSSRHVTETFLNDLRIRQANARCRLGRRP
jgi:hypothetical protein